MATSMPLQSDQSSAPTERNTGGRRYEESRPYVSRGPSRKRRRAASKRPNTEKHATSAAHTMSSPSRYPTSHPAASTNGYERLVLPDEYPLPTTHSNGWPCAVERA
jgi:hypothetical protein